MAVDRDVIRILGAWHRNNISEMAVWTPVLENVTATLRRWTQRNPTMEGRKHIISMVVGGKTQYLTQVQGMLVKVKEMLTKMIRTFAWGDRRQTPVKTDTVYAPVDKGGRGILNLEARNEANTLGWMRDYLTLGSERPLWAEVADAMLAHNTPKTEDQILEETRMNVFLQSWVTKVSEIPLHLKEAFKATKKYGIHWEGLTFHNDVLRDMPIWNHSEADPHIRRLNHSKASECL